MKTQDLRLVWQSVQLPQTVLHKLVGMASASVVDVSSRSTSSGSFAYSMDIAPLFEYPAG